MRLVFYTVIIIMYAVNGYSQNSGYVTYNFGIDVLSPVGTYTNFTTRSYVGADLGFLVTTKFKGLALGGHIGYGLQDQFNADYIGPSPIGTNTEYRESLFNTHIPVAMDARYMPYISDFFQPYLAASFGVRRIATYLVTTDIVDNVNAGNQVYQRSWTMQIGASAGVIIPLNDGFLIDIGARYMETQAARHLIRKSDWRTIEPFFSTDIYEEVRTGVKLMGINISVIYTP